MERLEGITDSFARSLYNFENNLVFDPQAYIQRYRGDFIYLKIYLYQFNLFQLSSIVLIIHHLRKKLKELLNLDVVR